MKVMDLLGMEYGYRQTSYPVKRYSNFTDAELSALSAAVVAANQKIIDARAQLATLQTEYDQLKAKTPCIQSVGPGDPVKFVMKCKDGSEYNNTSIQTLQWHQFYFPPYSKLVNRITELENLIGAKKSEITSLQEAYDTANKKYQDALNTLSPEQKVELQAQTQKILDAQKTSNIKNNILIAGAIVAVAAVVTGLFIYFKKKV